MGIIQKVCCALIRKLFMYVVNTPTKLKIAVIVCITPLSKLGYSNINSLYHTTIQTGIQ